jgi:DNA-binding transcriptional regulator YdaS (Cro superfamily)
MSAMDKFKTRRKAVADKVVKHFGSQTKVALALGYTDVRNVSPWTTGLRWFSPKACVQIERLTNGAITRRELRPHDFADHWPDLCPADKPTEAVA